MKQYQIRFNDAEDFDRRLADIRRACDQYAHGDITFYLSWSEGSHADLDHAIGQIGLQFPGSVYYGNEASGNISDGQLDYGLDVICYVFEEPTTRTELVWVERGTQMASLKDLWDYCKGQQGLCAVELIPTISYLETLKVDGNVPGLGDGVVIFGGASVNYDNPTFDADIIATGHARTKKGMAAMLYYGEDLQFSVTSVLGWKGLGNMMEVTRSQGKRIYEINGEPAYSIYEKYLNLTTDDSDTLVFPLILEEDGIEYIRTPQIIMQDKSMQMFAHIPKGSKVRISYGDKNTILDSLYDEATEIAAFKPEAIKAFSCAGRRYFWGDAEISKETLILQEVAPVCGFYTGGEILQFGKRLRVLNQTLCIVSLRESDDGEVRKPVNMTAKSPDKSLVSRLAYFVAKVSEEQQTAHQKVLEQQGQMRENIEIIGAMTNDYLALYYINLKDNSFRVYSLDGNRLADTKQLLTQDTDAFALIRKFAASPAVHPDDRHLFEELTREAVIERFKSSRKFTIRFRRDYGQGYKWSVMDVAKYEAQDEVANAIVIGFAERDQAIRNEIEQINNLKATEDLQKLLDSFADRFTSVFLLDENGTFTTVKGRENTPDDLPESALFYDLATMFADQSVYGPDREMFLAQCTNATIQARAAQERSYSVEFRVTSHKDGKRLWCEMVVRAFSDRQVLLAIRPHDNEIVRRLVDDKLYHEYASIFLVDLKTDTYRFLSRSADSGFQDVSGGVYSATIKEYTSRVHADYRKEWRMLGNLDKVRDILSKESRIEYAYPLEGIDKRWRRCVLQLLDSEDGVPTTFIMTYMTIDDTQAAAFELSAQVAKQKKLLESQHRQLQVALKDAQSANRAKTSFLNSMSHDIRTPMNAIIGYTSMTQKYIDDKEKAEDYLSKISSASNNLLELINQVLDMSRIESGKVELVEEPANVVSRAYEMTEIISHNAQVKNIKVTTEISHIHDRMVYADGGRMNQLIMNILGNAVKYTPEGGHIRYAVNQIECDKPGYGTYVFTTEDDGIGMSKEYLESIYEPFSRENTSTVSKIQGTGLGMAIVKRLVDLMGGQIDIESEPGKGTKIVVTLTFRLVENVQSKAVGQSEDYSILQGKRVLLVEDNEMNREIATMLLEEQGIIVESAEDGDVAIDMMKAIAKRQDWGYYDFILMDIQMPRMNGYEATKAIRSITTPRGLHIPIIAMTANAFAEDKAKALNAGMDEHIAKPIDVHVLWETLAKFA